MAHYAQELYQHMSLWLICTVLFSLSQAFCDPLQGFVNGIIFAFLSKAISERLTNCIGIPIKGLIKCISYPVTRYCCSKKHHIEGYSPVANSNIIDNEDQSLLQDV